MKTNEASQDVENVAPAGRQAAARRHSASLRSLQEERDHQKRKLALETVPHDAISGKEVAGMKVEQDDASAFSMQIDAQRPNWSQQ
jgi:hypothetical protein